MVLVSVSECQQQQARQDRRTDKADQYPDDLAAVAPLGHARRKQDIKPDHECDRDQEDDER